MELTELAAERDKAHKKLRGIFWQMAYVLSVLNK